MLVQAGSISSWVSVGSLEVSSLAAAGLAVREERGQRGRPLQLVAVLMPSFSNSGPAVPLLRCDMALRAVDSPDPAVTTAKPPLPQPASVSSAKTDGPPASRQLSFFVSPAAGPDGSEALGADSPLLARFIDPAEAPSAAAVAAAAQLSRAPKGRASGVSWESPRVDKRSGALVDMPVTFHSQIKSSGYGAKKPPRAAARSSSASRTGRRPAKPEEPRAGAQLVSYPADCGLLTAHDPASGYPFSTGAPRGGAQAAAPGPLHGVTYSPDGKFLGLVSQEGSVQTIRVPVSKHKGAGRIGAMRVQVLLCTYFISRCIYLQDSVTPGTTAP
jgi:hypothetical protein